MSKPAYNFLNKELSFPVLISCMTGGYKEAEKINRELAEVCEEKNLLWSRIPASSDGRQTTMLPLPLREKPPPQFRLVGNIGAPEVAN